MVSDGVFDVVLFRFDYWCVNLDLGGGWCLGLKRGESRWEREKEEREKKRNNEGEEREILGIKKLNKILIFFLQYRYSAILHVELHCSSIANFFAILGFYKFWL